MYVKTIKIKIVLLIGMFGILASCSSANNTISHYGVPKDVGSSFAPELASAYKAYDEGRLSDAETLFIKYTNKHPGFSEAWFKLGNIYYRTGQYSAAITAYNNAVQQNPVHGKAWYNMALTRIKQAEETIERGESILDVNDSQRLRLISLKNKIRSGIRQRPSMHYKVKAKQKMNTNNKKSRFKKKK